MENDRGLNRSGRENLAQDAENKGAVRGALLADTHQARLQGERYFQRPGEQVLAHGFTISASKIQCRNPGPSVPTEIDGQRNREVTLVLQWWDGQQVMPVLSHASGHADNRTFDLQNTMILWYPVSIILFSSAFCPGSVLCVYVPSTSSLDQMDLNLNTQDACNLTEVSAFFHGPTFTDEPRRWCGTCRSGGYRSETADWKRVHDSVIRCNPVAVPPYVFVWPTCSWWICSWWSQWAVTVPWKKTLVKFKHCRWVSSSAFPAYSLFRFVHFRSR